MVFVRDLKNKPHTLTLTNGEDIHIEPRGVVKVKESGLISDVMWRMAKKGLLAISVSPIEPVLVKQVITPQENEETVGTGETDSKYINKKKSRLKN